MELNISFLRIKGAQNITPKQKTRKNQETNITTGCNILCDVYTDEITRHKIVLMTSNPVVFPRIHLLERG